MLHNDTYDTHHTYPPPDLSPSTSEPTHLSSGAGRYEPWLILYPYRRHSMPTIKSAAFPQVLDGLGGKGKLNREPAPAVHAASSTGALPTPEAPYLSPTPAMATTPSKSLGDAVVDGFRIGDKVAPVGKSVGSRRRTYSPSGNESRARQGSSIPSLPIFRRRPLRQVILITN
ncbi:hypothetical protein FS749_011182 [Ceratobasidium sp. UAMH 11750]|nr:hypothetical protein FS749_011182 [Ceratobasidium sp. UAMH 11750]